MQKQKGVSTLILIIIIVAVAVVAVGGVLAYQSFSTKTQPTQPVVQTQQTKPTACTPNWKCDWGQCVNGSQTQSWIDPNNCGIPLVNVGACPRLTRACGATTNQTAQPSITVTSPNGGEQWKVGEMHNITWQTSNLADEVLGISLDGYTVHSNSGDEPYIIATVSRNSSPYSWTIPSVIPAGNYRIKIWNTLNANPQNEIVDISDNYFSIVAPTANQTAGWKTYTNTQYRFEFKYPVGTPIEAYTNGGLIVSLDTANGKMIVEVANKVLGGAKNPPSCDTASGSDIYYKTINGINFTVIDVSRLLSGNISTSATQYCILQNGTAYKLIPQIPYGNTGRVDVNNDTTLNQMISTFKFTK